MRLRISAIRAAASDRPPGYVEDVLAAGTPDGEWLEIPAEALAELRAKYRPAMPSLGTMAASAAAALVREVAARARHVPEVADAAVAARLEICAACPSFLPAQGRCSQCGCFMRFKARLRSQHCPLGKW